MKAVNNNTDTVIQHTKGEWNVYLGEKGKDGCRRAHINSALPNDMYETICTMSGLNGTEPGEVAKANAAHIVKCCNSHNALIDALKKLHEVVMQSDDRKIFDNGVNAEVVAKAKEALKNAE